MIIDSKESVSIPLESGHFVIEELNHKEQDELYQFITNGRPKVKEIDLKFQEIMLRK